VTDITTLDRLYKLYELHGGEIFKTTEKKDGTIEYS
jgi:hypothetical protein